MSKRKPRIKKTEPVTPVSNPDHRAPPLRLTNAVKYHASMYAPNGQLRAMVRMQHPQAPGLYYRHGDDVTPWVPSGYTTWRIDDWMKRFGSEAFDGRIWEFFGDPIELWPPGSEGKDKGGNTGED